MGRSRSLSRRQVSLRSPRRDRERKESGGAHRGRVSILNCLDSRRHADAYTKREKELEQRIYAKENKVIDLREELMEIIADLEEIRHLLEKVNKENAVLQDVVDKQTATIDIYENNEKSSEECFEELTKENIRLSQRRDQLESNQSMAAKRLNVCIEQLLVIQNESELEEANMGRMPEGVKDDKQAGGIEKSDDDDDEESSSEDSESSDVVTAHVEVASAAQKQPGQASSSFTLVDQNHDLSAEALKICSSKEALISQVCLTDANFNGMAVPNSEPAVFCHLQVPLISGLKFQ